MRRIWFALYSLFLLILEHLNYEIYVDYIYHFNNVKANVYLKNEIVTNSDERSCKIKASRVDFTAEKWAQQTKRSVQTVRKA